MLPRDFFFKCFTKDFHVTKSISCQFDHVTYVKNYVDLFACLTWMRKRTIKIFDVAPKFSAMPIFLDAPSNITACASAPISCSIVIDSFNSWQRMSLFNLFVRKYASGTYQGFLNLQSL